MRIAGACVAENAFKLPGCTTPAFKDTQLSVAEPSYGCVYICSPIKGNIKQNMRNAEVYCRFAFKSGFVPIAPHVYFPRFLDDPNSCERATGMRYGLVAMKWCKELWVFGLHISEGMKAEIEQAKRLKMSIRYLGTDMEGIDGQHI